MTTDQHPARAGIDPRIAGTPERIGAPPRAREVERPTTTTDYPAPAGIDRTAPNSTSVQMALHPRARGSTGVGAVPARSKSHPPLICGDPPNSVRITPHSRGSTSARALRACTTSLTRSSC